MDDREITRLLNDLQTKLKRAEAISERDRELLRQLSVDIESLLGHPDGLSAKEHRSVIERLRESITRFEVSHPDLTNVMARVSKTLGDMGI